jgi:hypothetical protein
MRKNNVRVNLLSAISQLSPLTEEQIVSRLALLSSGLAEP